MGRVLLLAVLVVWPPAIDDAADQAFAQLWDSAKADPAKSDFAAIRNAYIKTSNYQPYRIPGQEKVAVDKAMKSKDFTTAIAAVNVVLEKKPLDIDSHLLAAFLHSQAGDQKLEKMHKELAQGLLTAIMKGHDGTSLEEAIPVITVDEEYSVLKMLRVRSDGHELRIHNQKHYDVLKITPKDGQKDGPREIFFDVTVPMAELNRILQPKK